MAITLKHGVNPAVALTASFGSGQAAKRQELEKEQRTVQTAQRARDAQRAFQAAQAEKSRIFSREQGEAARALQLEDREAARALQLEDRETMREQGFEDEERRYSARQRQEYNSRWAAIEEAKQSGDFTPEEVVEIERQAMMQDAGMTVEKRLEEPTMTPEEMFKQKTVTREDGSVIGFKTDGTPFMLQQAEKTESDPDREPDPEEWRSRKQAKRTEMIVNAERDERPKGWLPSEREVFEETLKEWKKERNDMAELAGKPPPFPEIVPKVDPSAAVADIEEKVGTAPSSGVSDFFKRLVDNVSDAAALPLTLPVAAAKKGADYVKDTWRKPKENAPSENPDQEAEDWLKNNPDHPKADDVRKKLQKRRRTA